MADNRTEKPTPKRRDEARKKGQIARSTDLTSAAVLLGGVVALIITGPSMLNKFADVVRVGLSQSGDTHLAGRAGLGTLSSWAMMSLLSMAAPIAITAAAAGLVANLVQNRPRITGSAIKPQWSKVEPAHGHQAPGRDEGALRRGQDDHEGRRRRRRGVRRHLAAPDHAGRARGRDARPDPRAARRGDHEPRPVRLLRLHADRDHRLRLAALPAREVAEDDQGGGEAGVAPVRPRPRGARRDPPAPVRAAPASA